MKTARRELQKLKLSDPAARSNMLSHVTALTHLVAGWDPHDVVPGEPVFQSIVQQTAGERGLCTSAAAASRLDHVLLAFDVDDAAGSPLGVGLVRFKGDTIACYLRCGLWMPASSGRGLVVPMGTDRTGHFAFERGKPLRYVSRRVAGDPAAGYSRGPTRLKKLAHSLKLQKPRSDGYLSVVQGNGWGPVRTRTVPFSA